MQNNTNWTDSPNRADDTGSDNEPNIDPKETYLEIITIINQISTATTRTLGATTRSTPVLVATPFPPLNLRKTGHICPEIAANPKMSLKK